MSIQKISCIMKRQPIRVLNSVTNHLSTHSNKEPSSGKKPTEKIANSTLDQSEVLQHEKYKNVWWNLDGPMKPLHSLNKLRVQYVRDGLLNTLPFLENNRNTSKPLKGLKLLDVGCGGGILSEPLSRLGASVTGLDASPELITLATEHSKQSSLENIRFVNDTIENFAAVNSEQYDGIVASEIIEHVNNKDLFVDSCVKTLKPGGSIFITTINKTSLSWFGGIIFAEHVLRIIPQGTHEWDKFISPHEMSRMVDKYGCKTKLIHGMVYNFFMDKWYWTSNTSINYALHAVKKIS